MTASRKALIGASLAAIAVILPFALKSTQPQTASATTSPTEADYAEAARQGFNPDMARAMYRDLGVTPKNLASHFEVEQQASKIQEDAKHAFGERYAGTWLETDKNGNRRIVVATTTSITPERFENAEVRHVRFSEQELSNAMVRLNETHRQRASKRTFSGVQSWSLDLMNNAVEISVLEGHESDAIDFAAYSGLDTATLRITTTEAPAVTSATSIYGGLRYDMTDDGQYWSCSIGFPVTKTVGTTTTKGFVTAGHCPSETSSPSTQSVDVYPAGSRYYANASEVVGSFKAVDFPGTDMAWAEVGSNSVYGQVYNYGETTTKYTKVTGSTESVLNASICRYGYVSKWSCGTITSTDVSVSYGDQEVTGLRRSTACTTQGDSGGPWLSGTQAQGVTSGGDLPYKTTFDNISRLTNCSQTASRRKTYYQPLKPILNEYGLTLKTS